MVFTESIASLWASGTSRVVQINNGTQLQGSGVLNQRLLVAQFVSLSRPILDAHGPSLENLCGIVVRARKRSLSEAARCSCRRQIHPAGDRNDNSSLVRALSITADTAHRPIGSKRPKQKTRDAGTPYRERRYNPPPARPYAPPYLLYAPANLNIRKAKTAVPYRSRFCHEVGRPLWFSYFSSLDSPWGYLHRHRLGSRARALFARGSEGLHGCTLRERNRWARSDD